MSRTKIMMNIMNDDDDFREKEGMMEYVYQYDNLQKQLQLLQ